MGTRTEGVIGYSNQLLADPNYQVYANGYQIEWPKVPDIYRTGSFIVQLNGAVAVNDTALVVDALTGPVYAGTVLDFQSAKGFAKVTADAAIGATSITVAALPAIIADNAQAVVAGSGPKVLKAGTVVGKLGSTSGKQIYPRVVTANPAIGILKEDCVEGMPSSGHTGHGVWEGGYFWENRLPDAVANGGTLPGAIKTELGTRFLFKIAENNAATL